MRKSAWIVFIMVAMFTGITAAVMHGCGSAATPTFTLKGAGQ